MSAPRHAHSKIHNDSRRTFLKTTAVAGAATVVPSLIANRAYAAGEEEPIKVALIGCGGRGTGAAAQALSTEGPIKLWAMADAFYDRLEGSLKSLTAGLKARYDRASSQPLVDRINVPKERQFVGLDAYQKAIASGVDVVIITGPPGFRPLHFEAAVNAGKHVFMEKPLASDGTGVRRILESAQKAKEKNLKVGVGLQRHYQPSYLTAMKRIHDGEFGDILNMRCYWNTGFPAKTPFPREKSISELQHQIRNWYFFDWLSGDHICEQHIHNLDVCNWAKGDYPVEAEGMGGRQVRTGKEYGNIFDHHAVIYTYADGTKMHSYCRQIPACSKMVAEFIEMTNGVAELSNRGCKLTNRKEELWKSPREKESPYQLEHDALFAAIRNDTPHNEAENGAKSTMTAILGRMATYSGVAIKWDDAINKSPQLTTDTVDWQTPAPVQPEDDGSYQIAVPGLTEVMS